MSSDRYLKKFSDKYPKFDFMEFNKTEKYFIVRCKICRQLYNKSQESFWRGYGCRFCANNQKLTFEKFFKKLPIDSGLEPVFNKKDWNQKYKNTKTKFSFKCKKCKYIFKTTPNSVLYSKSKCPVCSTSKKAWRKMTYPEFLNKTRGLVNDKFLFDSNDWEHIYQRSKLTKFKFKCSKNHVYETTIDSYLNGSRCPLCSKSKGEKKIQNFLEVYKIKFISEKIFKNCHTKIGSYYRFDFFLPAYNLVIEFDGKHHFEDIDFFKSICSDIQKKDLDKNNFCKMYNINIIRIPFWEIGNIEYILKSLLWQLEE